MSDIINSSAISNPHVNAWIKEMWSRGYSCEVVTFRHTYGVTTDFVDGQTLKLSGGKYSPADGATAAGILAMPLYDVATSTDVDAVVLLRGPAVVVQDQLLFEISSTDPDNDPDVAAQVAALKALSPPILCVRTASPSITL